MDRKKNYGAQVPALVSLFPDGLSNALDVGCSNGGLGAYLKKEKQYSYVAGIEYNEETAKVAGSVIDDVFVGDAGELVLPENFENFFDIIIYGDVLEHLYDPWKVLANHQKYLKKDGVIAASIPNIKNLYIILSLISGRFDYTEFGLMDESHIRFFTFETMLEMFQNAGYELSNLRHSIRDGEWFVKQAGSREVNTNLIAFYNNIYQEHMAGKDCSNYIKQCFPVFNFSKESVVDFLTVQYHCLFKLK